MVDLVFDTIREPKRIVDVPVAVGKLLAAPRERFFKSVGSHQLTASMPCMPSRMDRAALPCGIVKSQACDHPSALLHASDVDWSGSGR